MIKLSDVVKELNKLKKLYGDLPVKVYGTDYLFGITVITDDDGEHTGYILCDADTYEALTEQ